MNRRGFLQCLGVFAASAAIPKAFALEKIARAPAWAEEVTLYRVSTPLVAGNYTFTAGAGELGMYIGGVVAAGGETLFEIPANLHLTDPRITLGGLYYNLGPAGITGQEMLLGTQRGEPVIPA